MTAARPPSGRPRRGVASLELVLGLPFLIMIVALIFSLGRAALLKFEAVVAVRSRAFTTAAVRSSRPLTLAGSERDGLAAATIRRPYSVRPFRVVPLEIEAGVAVLRGSWDSRATDLDFPERGGGLIPRPHFEVLELIGTNRAEILLGGAAGEVLGQSSRAFAGSQTDLLQPGGGQGRPGGDLGQIRQQSGAIGNLIAASNSSGWDRIANVASAAVDLAGQAGTLGGFSVDNLNPYDDAKLFDAMPRVIAQLKQVGQFPMCFPNLIKAVFAPRQSWEPFEN